MEMEDAPLIPTEPENELFYFETDHLALKGDKDYCDVLKTVVTLTAIREKAIKDYSKVIEAKKRILEEDPEEIVRRIQSGKGLGLDLPNRLQIPKLPVINFEKFQIKVPESELQSIYSDGPITTVEENKVKVAPTTKAWTTEEQKKLEELLLVYPPEPVEMNRFKKIADALGTRTVQQVSSRVQKYFIKLYEAGLPIPGRIPKGVERHKKVAKRHHWDRNSQQLLKPTTFFPDLITPVVMDENEHAPGPTNTSTPTSSPSNYLIQSSYHQSNELNPVKSDVEMQLILLRRIKSEKLKEQDSNYGSVRHAGFKCDYCDTEPIMGARWHCLTCMDSVDFCTDCVLAQMYSGHPHPLNHVLAVFHNEMDPGAAVSDSESLSLYKNDSSSDEDDIENVKRSDADIKSGFDEEAN